MPLSRRITVTILSLLGTSTAGLAQQINVLDAGTRSQLLLDPDLVHESRNIAFTLHQARKHSANPIARADQPWEGWYATIFAGTVLYDEQERLFKMWYACPGNREYFDVDITCYAVSKDGLKWDKPLVGTIAAKNGKAHNAVAAVLCPSVFHDAGDPAPARRYKMVCYKPNRGYLAMISPDGLHWTEQDDKPIVPISYVDDVVSAFRDRRDGRYVALAKMSTPVFGRTRRTIYSSSSFDFRNWSKPEVAFIADRRDDLGSLARLERARPLLNYPFNFHVMRTEFYGAAGYSAESCVIAFPWTFTISSNVPQKGNQDGPIETQIALSRDLESWRRPFRTPAIAPGEIGAWDGGMILTASQAIDVGDEVWLYYDGANYTHGAPVLYNPADKDRGAKYTSAIGLATWPRDRFASADGPPGGGMLTTVPFRFAGDRLEINAAVHSGGTLQVELLDPAGRPIAGYPPSVIIKGDNLRHVAILAGTGKLADLADKPICLRFHLYDAELYAFAFRGS